MPHTPREIIDNWTNPDFKFFVNRPGSIPEREQHLLERDNLRDEYLGACLDYIRWGSPTSVMYEHGTRGLINFIQTWMRANRDNLIWRDRPLPEGFSLPYLNHESCPRNSTHSGTIKDIGGRVRCAHVSERGLKEGYIGRSALFDKLSGMRETIFYDSSPSESQASESEIQAYEDAPIARVFDPCYAVLSDKGILLSLETVLNRLNVGPTHETNYCNRSFLRGRWEEYCERVGELSETERRIYASGKKVLCPGHEDETNQTIHNFDGWTFAGYVQKWYEQVPDGKAPVFNHQLAQIS